MYELYFWYRRFYDTYIYRERERERGLFEIPHIFIAIVFGHVQNITDIYIYIYIYNKNIWYLFKVISFRFLFQFLENIHNQHSLNFFFFFRKYFCSLNRFWNSYLSLDFSMYYMLIVHVTGIFYKLQTDFGQKFWIFFFFFACVSKV